MKRECPHKIVNRRDTRGDIVQRELWSCEWCHEEFIPATEDALALEYADFARRYL